MAEVVGPVLQTPVPICSKVLVISPTCAMVQPFRVNMLLQWCTLLMPPCRLWPAPQLYVYVPIEAAPAAGLPSAPHGKSSTAPERKPLGYAWKKPAVEKPSYEDVHTEKVVVFWAVGWG